MDASHQAELRRILENRKRRQSSVAQSLEGSLERPPGAAPAASSGTFAVGGPAASASLERPVGADRQSLSSGVFEVQPQQQQQQLQQAPTDLYTATPAASRAAPQQQQQAAARQPASAVDDRLSRRDDEFLQRVSNMQQQPQQRRAASPGMGDERPPLAPTADQQQQQQQQQQQAAVSRRQQQQAQYGAAVGQQQQQQQQHAAGDSPMIQQQPPHVIHQPQQQQQQYYNRSASMASDSAISESTANASSSAAGLFQRNSFANFRSKPILVSPNIRPYRSEPEEIQLMTRQERKRVVAQQRLQEEASRKVTRANPFRTQDFDTFVHAPSYAVPHRLQEQIATMHSPHRDAPGGHGDAGQHVPGDPGRHATALARSRSAGEMVGAASPHQHQQQQQTFPGLNASVQHSASAVYDLNDVIPVLERGDWFMKWTQRKDKVHRRFFHLDLSRSMLYWAKTPDAYTYLRSGVKIEEITEIQTQCVVDDITAKTFYLLIINSVSRITQIGTEQREKFDMWYDALTRITESVRDFNSKFFGRSASNTKMTQPVVFQTGYDRAGPLPSGD